MKSLTVVFGILIIGSSLSPGAVSAEVLRPQNRPAQPLAAAVRAAFYEGSASYLHTAMASALGMESGSDSGISIYQRETKADEDGGRLIAVTLREKGGQHHIVFATWNKTEVRAYLTSETGVLKKAIQGTKEGGWTAMSGSAAQQGFATEKDYWVSASESASRPVSPDRRTQ